MKPGDTCWIKTVYQGVEDSPSDGYPCTVYYGMPADGDVLPDSPMLPAVARWLAEHNDALVYGQHTPGDWIDVLDAYADEGDNLADRMMLKESVIPALRSLIAALSEGKG